MKISTSQQPVYADMGKNLSTIIDVLENTKDSDWVLTPEGSLSGYCANVCHESTETQKQEYFKVLDELETYLQKNKRSIALGTGHIEQDGFPYNQIRYYYQGNLIAAYNKQLLTKTANGGLGEYYYYLPGQTSLEVEVAQDFTVGSLLCNDAWAFPSASPDGNPYLWKDYTQSNCVFVSANCSTDELDPTIYTWHENHLQLHAKLNKQYVVISAATTDMIGNPVDFVQAPSGIIGPNGEWIDKCKNSDSDIVTVEVV